MAGRAEPRLWYANFWFNLCTNQRQTN